MNIYILPGPYALKTAKALIQAGWDVIVQPGGNRLVAYKAN